MIYLLLFIANLQNLDRMDDDKEKKSWNDVHHPTTVYPLEFLTFYRIEFTPIQF